MAAKTWNVSSGNWSTAGNWSPSGVPGTGDTVTVGSGRSCTIDANADFGNDSTGATPALTIAGSGSSVTISSGVTVKCRGDLKIDAGYNATATLTLSSGSKFLFTPANNTAQFQFAATTYNHNKIVINGTSGARCTFGTDAVRYSAGGSSDSNVTSAYFPQAPYHGTSGLVTASYCDFYNMGSSSNWGLTSECATNGAGNGLDVSITNCTFTRCNYRAEQYGSETWDKNYTFQGNTFASSVACSSGVGAASCYAVLLLSTRSTGTRLIDSNVFDGVWTANSAIGCTVTRNVMLGACATSGGSAWDKFAGNAIRLTSTSDGAIALYQVGDTLETDEWNYLHMHNDGGSAMVNSHPIALPNTRSVKVRGWILDPGNVTLSGDQPDLIQPVAGPASAMTIDVSYNLSLPIAAGAYIGQDGGVLFGCSIDATNWKISATHNTACTSAGDAIARYGETNAGTAGMYGQTLDANHKGVKANLAWSATSNTAAIFSRISQNSVQNGLAAADGDYNATWNGRTTAGTHGDTWVRGYVDMAPTGGVAMFSTSTGLGANDKTLAGNPFYDVDMTTNSWRNIASWAVSKGQAVAGDTYQAKVTAAYAYLKTSPGTLIADLVSWIKDGWRVKDATLNNAGHDGATIGALGYQAVASGLTAAKKTAAAWACARRAKRP